MYFKHIDEDAKICNIYNAQTLQSVSQNFPYSRLSFSPGGKYFFYQDNIEKISEWTIRTKVYFYRTPNTFLWETEYEADYEYSTNAFFVSDFNGYVVETHAMTGLTRFYNEKGELFNEVDLFKNDQCRRMRGIYGKYSENGKYFIARLYGDDGTSYSNGSAIILFTSKGDQIWVFEPEEKQSSDIYISNDGSFVLSFFSTFGKNVRTVYFHNKSGILLGKYDKIGFGDVAFGENNKYAAFSYGNRFKLINLETGEDEWGRTRYCRGRRDVLDLDISEKLGIVVLAVGEVYGATGKQPYTIISNSMIRLIDFTGETVSEIQLPDIEKDIGKYTRTYISTSENGEKIGLFYGSKYYLYELQNQ